jgi:hypothetical protein
MALKALVNPDETGQGLSLNSVHEEVAITGFIF